MQMNHAVETHVEDFKGAREWWNTQSVVPSVGLQASLAFGALRFLKDFHCCLIQPYCLPSSTCPMNHFHDEPASTEQARL